jgi:hypothetical protein
MAKFTLSTYSVRILDKETDLTKTHINNFHNGESLKKVFKDFFDHVNQQTSDVNSIVNLGFKSVFRVEQRCEEFQNQENTCSFSFCIVKSGEYGAESDLYDVKTKISRRKKVTEAELLPFMVFLEQPNRNVNEAILLFQNFKGFGVKTAFCREFLSYFNNKFDRYKLEIKTLIPEGVLQRLFQNDVKELNFIKFNTSGIEKNFDEGHQEEEGKIKISITPKSKHFLPINNMLNRIINRTTPSIKGYFELSEDLAGFEYDDIQIVIEENGIPRRISLNRMNLPSYRINIEDSVILDDTGHPTNESLKAVASEQAVSIRMQITGN